MTRQEIIQLIDDCKPTPELREMVVKYVNAAYDSGFQEGFSKGIKHIAETIEVVNNALLHSNDCPECHVSLNKDGSCPSCEQDHADNVREAGQGK